jgi:hypothetical protein
MVKLKGISSSELTSRYRNFREYNCTIVQDGYTNHSMHTCPGTRVPGFTARNFKCKRSSCTRALCFLHHQRCTHILSFMACLANSLVCVEAVQPTLTVGPLSLFCCMLPFKFSVSVRARLLTRHMHMEYSLFAKLRRPTPVAFQLWIQFGIVKPERGWNAGSFSLRGFSHVLCFSLYGFTTEAVTVASSQRRVCLLGLVS